MFSVVYFVVFFSSSLTYSQLTWTRLPGPPTGNIRDVIVDNGGTIFLAHADFNNDGGIYRSTNNGVNFVKILPGPGTDVRSLARDRVNNIYYAALGNGGVKKSTNNCLTWTEIGFSLSDVNKIFYEKNGLLFAGYGVTVQRSTNGGGNWNIVYTAPSPINCFAQDSSNNIYAGTLSNGMLRSTNSGTNWINILPGNKINCLHVNPLGHIYAGTVDSGIFLSTNNGQLWSKMNTPFLDASAIYSISNFIFASTAAGIFKSSNFGLNWNITSEVHDGTAFTTDSGSNILLGTQYGIYRSTDQGTSWVYLGLYISNVKDVKALNNGNIFTITYGLEPYENLVWISQDLGNTWKRVLKSTQFLDKMEIDSSNRLYVCTNSGVINTSNNGSNWTNIGPSGTSINRIRINSSGHLFICTNNGIQKSLNMGLNWINCSPVTEPFRSMTITPGNVIFAANYYTGNSYIFRSSDLGDSWANIGNPSSPIDGVNSIVSDFDGNIYTQIIYSIYKSTNSGNTWNNTTFFGTTYNLYSTPANHIYFTINAPWRTTDGGVTYQELTGAGGTCIAYHPSNVMLAGSSNSGLYRSSTLTAISNQNSNMPGDFVLLRNYPNPFNSNTVINFDISSYNLNLQGNIRLSIYDILGKEITVLLDEKIKAGEYEINWNAESFASGLYFTKLSINGVDKIHKMVLLK